ncbi:SET domain-containing protein 9 [Porphyridium purpureum]|uniref:SET domain-containing protein 9 n=1 Tax=Porphyridium purpureum TaxID=35688 RepID=A0A5J4YIS9_PORPP|nr:SET domain-containing protein 9 [Porphyridium purpureum]|eukprot:POR5454..scf270_19
MGHGSRVLLRCAAGAKDVLSSQGSVGGGVGGIAQRLQQLREQWREESIMDRDYQGQFDLERVFRLTEYKNRVDERALAAAAPSPSGSACAASDLAQEPLPDLSTQSLLEGVKSKRVREATKRELVEDNLRKQIDQIMRVLVASSLQYPQLDFPLLPPTVREAYLKQSVVKLERGAGAQSFLARSLAAKSEAEANAHAQSQPREASGGTELGQTKGPTQTAPPEHESEDRRLALSRMEERVFQRLGYSVYRQKSTIPDGGDGVFLRGRVSAGTVVGFYPGVCYSPGQLEYLPGYPQYSVDNEHVLERFDGTMVDGKAENSCHTFFGAQLISEGSEEATRRFWMYLWQCINPFAVGHVFNHPPAGAPVHVVIAPFDFDIQEIPELARKFLPNRQYIAHKPRDIFARIMHGKAFQTNRIPGVALVTTRNVEDGEELFLNYRFNPNFDGLPSWYIDPDPDESARRWMPFT